LTLKADESGLTMQYQCKACIHLDKVPLPGAKKSCSKMGILANATMCKEFNPDITDLANSAAGVSPIRMIGRLQEVMTEKQMQLLSWLLRMNYRTKKVGLKLGGKVAFCLSGDYLNNYFQGYVMSVSKDMQFVTILADLQKNGSASAIILMRESVYNWKQYQKKRKALVKEGLIMEPRRGSRPTLYEELHMTKDEFLRGRAKLATRPADYVPPSMDNVPATWLDKRRITSFSEDARAAVAANVKKSKDLTRKTIEKAKTKAGNGTKVVSKSNKVVKTSKRSNNGSFVINRQHSRSIA
jgi:hypothetical protein